MSIRSWVHLLLLSGTVANESSGTAVAAWPAPDVVKRSARHVTA